MGVYDSRGAGNVHIDQILSGISVAYDPGEFVGDVLFPTVRVTKQSDKYFIFGKEAWALPNEGDLRAPGTEANEIPGLLLSTDQYFATEHALRIAVTDEERENADAPLNSDREGTELVTQAIILGRELAIKNLVTTAANYPAGGTVTLAGTTQWSDYVNSDPIANFKTGRRYMHATIFREPNLAVIPYQVMSILEDHPDFIERIKYSQRGVVTEELIAALIGIPRVVVPKVGYNSANPTATEALGYLWGKDVLLAYVPAAPGRRTAAFGYEFVWPIQGQVQAAFRWREQKRRSDLIEVARRYDLKFVSKDTNGKVLAGYLIKAAVA